MADSIRQEQAAFAELVQARTVHRLRVPATAALDRVRVAGRRDPVGLRLWRGWDDRYC